MSRGLYLLNGRKALLWPDYDDSSIVAVVAFVVAIVVIVVDVVAIVVIVVVIVVDVVDVVVFVAIVVVFVAIVVVFVGSFRVSSRQVKISVSIHPVMVFNGLAQQYDTLNKDQKT